MADNKLYAWSDILVGDKTVACGASVTAATVGGKEELDNLIANGVVRSEAYPVPEGVVESPNTYRLKKIREELEAAGQSIEELG